MPGGIRRKKLAKSGASQKVRRKAAKQRKRKHVYDNPLIEANWDPKLTVAQNYKKLGLASNLQRATGGVEDKESRADIRTVASKVKTGQIVQDADGNAKVVYSTEDDEDDIDSPIKTYEGKTDVVRQLEEEAKSAKRTVRHQSEEERSWLARLIAKHGEDYRAMQWDRKLNQFQHTAGELKRRVKRFHELAAGSD